MSFAIFQAPSPYFPTEKADQPESDGTLEWQKTTLVVAEVTAGGKRGLGYTYANQATARLIKDDGTRLQDGRPMAHRPPGDGRHLDEVV